MALTVKMVEVSTTENFPNVDVRRETPLHIYVHCMARGHKPKAGHVWKMTLPVGPGGTKADFNDFVTLDTNGVADGDTVWIIEQ